MPLVFAFSDNEGGDDKFSLRFIIFPLYGLFDVFSVMSDFYFDGLGFVYPRAPPSAPSSLDYSSLENLLLFTHLQDEY